MERSLCPRTHRASRFVVLRPRSFKVNNGFMHKEGILVLPITWWRYITALIKHSYYKRAGAQCYKSGWKTGSDEFPFPQSSGKQCSSPDIISAAIIKNGRILVMWNFCLGREASSQRLWRLGKHRRQLPAIRLWPTIKFYWMAICLPKKKKQRRK